MTGRLPPDFKTIANFRCDNGPGLPAVCRQFVMLCRSLGLFGQAVVAVDGSKFKTVNNRDRNFTANKGGGRIEQVDASMELNLAALDRVDRAPGDLAEARTERIKEKLTGLRRHMQFLKEMERRVEVAPDHQVSLTDPDARAR